MWESVLKISKSIFATFLIWLSLSSLLSLPCYGEVVLTDEEARELMGEIETAESDLTRLKETSEQELTALKSIYEEQKKYYEEQLKEQRRKQILPWTLTGCSSTAVIVLSIVLLVALL